MLGAIEDEDRRVRLAHLEEKIVHPRSVLNVDSLLVSGLLLQYRKINILRIGKEKFLLF